MTAPDSFTVLDGGSSIEERSSHFSDGADALATGAGRWAALRNQRFLLGLSAALMTLGISAVLLGWLGASHTPYVEEQTPYLISGGLLGIALSLIGAVTFFAHWLAALLHEVRGLRESLGRNHDEMMELLRSQPGNGESLTKVAAGAPGRRTPPSVKRSSRSS